MSKKAKIIIAIVSTIGLLILLVLVILNVMNDQDQDIETAEDQDIETAEGRDIETAGSFLHARATGSGPSAHLNIFYTTVGLIDESRGLVPLEGLDSTNFSIVESHNNDRFDARVIKVEPLGSYQSNSAQNGRKFKTV